MSRFACPSADLSLGQHFGETRRVLSMALLAAAAVHLSLSWMAGPRT